MELIKNEIGLLSELAEKISREQRKREKKNKRTSFFQSNLSPVKLKRELGSQ